MLFKKAFSWLSYKTILSLQSHATLPASAINDKMSCRQQPIQDIILIIAAAACACLIKDCLTIQATWRGENKFMWVTLFYYYFTSILLFYLFLIFQIVWSFCLNIIKVKWPSKFSSVGHTEVVPRAY